MRRQFLEPMVGKHSLLSLDGDPWWRHRRLLSPPLHGKAIARYREEIAEIAPFSGVDGSLEWTAG